MERELVIVGWVTVVLVALSGTILGEDVVDPEVGDPFPLPFCIMSEEMLDEESEISVDRGRETRFCCEDCMSKFEQEAYIRVGEIDKALTEQQLPYYPLEKGIVSGDPLGEGAVDHIFRNRLFRLSSEAQIAVLEAAPAQYFAELDQAVTEKQASNYPLETCVVSGDPLGDGALENVVANQLVRLAGFEQLVAFDENPGKYLAELREASE
ncbi:MAG: hypothetical protein ACC661_01010 [Verrucomicrobiales bacterium]